jgi:hypothetical protein
MKKRNLTNAPESAHNRLLNLARETKRPFNELLQHYAMERFLFRLGASDHADRFVLKGALMLRVWNLPLARPTMDIDLLGRTLNSVDGLVEIIPLRSHSESARSSITDQIKWRLDDRQ